MHRHIMEITVAVCAALSVVSIAAELPLRSQVCLNGVWQFSPGTLSETKPAVDAKWVAMPVPSFWDRAAEFGVKATWSDDLSCGWYRREFTVPNDWKGRRIVLRFDAVRYACEVFVNDRRVGESADGFIGFAIDITEIVRLGGPNGLSVKAVNWRGVLAEDRRDVDMPVGKTVTGTNAFLSPIGPTPRCGNMAGIWQDVWVEALPTVRIERVKIETDVLSKTISVAANVSKAVPAGMKMRFTVLDGERSVVTMNAGAAIRTTASSSWHAADVKLWWPHDPRLYTLRAELIDAAGRVIDATTTRFGFRQIEIRKDQLYLNGERLNLRGDHWMPLLDAAGSIALRPEFAKAYFELFKRCNINVVRLHGSPMPSAMLDAADEVGMLIIDESANYGSDSHLRFDDPVFQKRCAEHIERWIQRDWNHPSVIAWSLGNEFSPPEAFAETLYRLAKRLDATRIAYVDCGSEKSSDAISPHYVWHWARSYQLPNTAYWFGDAAMCKTILGKTREAIGKPCFMGEYLDAGTSANAAAASVVLGPGYEKVSSADRLAMHFRVLRMVAEGARATDLPYFAPFCLVPHTWMFCSSGGPISWPDRMLPGIKPLLVGQMVVNPGFVPGDRSVWGPMLEDVRHAYSPLYAYCRDYSHTFYSGQKVTRRVTVFNDDLRSIVKTVRWSVSVADKTIASGTHVVGSKIGFADAFDVAFDLPNVSARTAGAMVLKTYVGDEPVDENRIAFSIYPKPSIAYNASKIGFWRVSAEHVQLLKSLGIVGRDVASPADLSQVQLVIVGAYQADDPRHAKMYEAIARFVSQGGRVLALPQNESADWMPGRLKVDVNPSAWTTIGFLGGAELSSAGLTNDDLRFWWPDHVIGRRLFLANDLPPQATPMIVSGSTMGMAHAALVRYAYGRGFYLLCQMPMIDCCEKEAAAGVLAAELVRYGLSTPSATSQASSSASTFSYRRRVEIVLHADQALPPTSADAYRVASLSEVYGCTYPIIDMMKEGASVKWRLSNLPSEGIDAVITARVRVGDGGHSSRNEFSYRVLVNDRPVAMDRKYDQVRMTFDSFQGWQIWMGHWRSQRPVRLRNGDVLTIVANQMWSSITDVTLSVVQ